MTYVPAELGVKLTEQLEVLPDPDTSVQVPDEKVPPKDGLDAKLTTPVGWTPPVPVAVATHALGEPRRTGFGEQVTATEMGLVIISDSKGRVWL